MARGRSVLKTTLVVFCLAVAAVSVTTSPACELCGQPTPTLAEQFSLADAVVRARWIKAEPARPGRDLGRTLFEVVRIARDTSRSLRVGDAIAVDGQQSGWKLDQFLPSARKGDAREWDIPMTVSEASLKYIIDAPPLVAPPAERLSDFLNHLEAGDVTIAHDAFAEFVRAPFGDIALVRDQLPRDPLRRWVVSSKPSGHRRRLYGRLLGPCGDASDARRLETIRRGSRILANIDSRHFPSGC